MTITENRNAPNARPTSQNRPLTMKDVGCQDDVLLNEWHVVGFSTDFEPGKPYPVRLLGRDIMVWRDSKDQLHAWEDLCIHRGARLSFGSIKNDEVVCPYHGWRYNTEAQCTLIPSAPNEKPMAKAKAFPWSVEERYGFAWVCLGDPQVDIPNFPQWDDPDQKKVHVGPFEFGANGYRAIENFVDITHFPFVHGGTNGDPDNPDEIPPFTVEMTDEGLVTTEIPVFQPVGDARGLPTISGYTYRVHRPLVAAFTKRLFSVDENRHPLSADAFFTIYMTAQVVSETHAIVRVCTAVTAEGAASDEDIRKRVTGVFTEDEEIVATQRPERIPAELRYELHHRNDLLAQKYRGWLRELGVTYGTI